LAIDLITRDENIRWLFHADIDNTQVNALAAVLAESMTIPDVERDELQRRRYAPIEAGKKGESTGTRSTEPTGSEVQDLRCRVGLEPIDEGPPDRTYRAWSRAAERRGLHRRRRA